MPDGLNRVMLMGNLGADPDLRFGQGGADSAVLKLRLATTESYFDKRANERKERTDWHNVVLFGKRAEALQKILSKGSTIFVEGRLATSSYENKEGQKVYRTEVVATNVILAGGRGRGTHDDAPQTSGPDWNAPRPQAAAPRAPRQDALPATEADYGGAGDMDDIPFAPLGNI